MNNSPWLIRLTLVSILLCSVVVALGAWTRLSDAGLGCPDWPGCYGFISVPNTAEEIKEANAAYPERPVEAAKAWPEMIHRYFASTLGLCITIIMFLSLFSKQQGPRPVKLSVGLFLLVVFQGLLGMWTVTLGLFPTVVMAHLLGGFTTLSLLFLLFLRTSGWVPDVNDAGPQSLRSPAVIAIVILVLQIALGGWTAANYAAVVCTGLPICQGEWTHHLSWGEAFKFWGYGLDDYEFALHLSPAAKITIHAMHRIGAIITTLYLGWLCLMLWNRANSSYYKRLALIIAAILVLQVGLGVSNVMFGLPLFVAVAHNGIAAILLLGLVALNFSIYQHAIPAGKPA